MKMNEFCVCIQSELEKELKTRETNYETNSRNELKKDAIANVFLYVVQD